MSGEEKKEIRKKWKDITKKCLDTSSRKIERESLYSTCPNYKWLVKRASKDAWEEISFDTKEGSQDREIAVQEFIMLYPNSKKAKKLVTKQEFNSIQEMPNGIEKKRKIKDFYKRHPKKAILKVAGKTLITLGVIAIISVSVFQAVTYFQGDDIKADKIPGAEMPDNDIEIDDSPIIESPTYVQQPQEPMYTEQESQIKEENSGHEFVGAEDDMGNFSEEVVPSESENILEK